MVHICCKSRIQTCTGEVEEITEKEVKISTFQAAAVTDLLHPQTTSAEHPSTLCQSKNRQWHDLYYHKVWHEVNFDQRIKPNHCYLEIV